MLTTAGGVEGVLRSMWTQSLTIMMITVGSLMMILTIIMMVTPNHHDQHHHCCQGQVEDYDAEDDAEGEGRAVFLREAPNNINKNRQADIVLFR